MSVSTSKIGFSRKKERYWGHILFFLQRETLLAFLFYSSTINVTIVFKSVHILLLLNKKRFYPFKETVWVVKWYRDQILQPRLGSGSQAVLYGSQATGSHLIDMWITRSKFFLIYYPDNISVCPSMSFSPPWHPMHL